MLTSNNVDVIMRRLAGILRAAYGSNTDGSTMFGGYGVLDDMTVDMDGYTGGLPKEFLIRISGTGTPDSLRFSVDRGATWSAAANITGSSQALADGVMVTFGATTGHTLGSYWMFTADPAFAGSRVRAYTAALTDFDIIDAMVASVKKLGNSPMSAYSGYKAECTAVAKAVASNVGNLDTFLTSNTLMVPAECRDLGVSLSAANVEAPPTILGEFEYSGDAAGTFTQRETINKSLYSAAQLEVLSLSDVTGAGAGIATLDGTDFDEAAINKSTAAVFGAQTQYDVYDLSADYSERFLSVTGMTVTGGASGEKFIIRTKTDKLPIL